MSRGKTRWGLGLATALALATPAATTTPAAAEVVRNAKSHFQLSHDPAWSVQWTAAATPAAGEKPVGELLTAVHKGSDARASVVRVNQPNRPAWRRQKHYFDNVTRGLKGATRGFVLERSKRSRVDSVPILDLRYRRASDKAPHVATRFVFFRTFTLIITVTSDRRRRRDAAKLAEGLVPRIVR